MTAGLGQCEYCGAPRARGATACTYCDAPLQDDVTFQKALDDSAGTRPALEKWTADDRKLRGRLDKLRLLLATPPPRETAISFFGALLSLRRHPIVLGFTYLPVISLTALPMLLVLRKFGSEDYDASLRKAYWVAAIVSTPLSALAVAFVLRWRARSRAREAALRHRAGACGVREVGANLGVCSEGSDIFSVGGTCADH